MCLVSQQGNAANDETVMPHVGWLTRLLVRRPHIRRPMLQLWRRRLPPLRLPLSTKR
jgi:hypothetical protein